MVRRLEVLIGARSCESFVLFCLACDSSCIGQSLRTEIICRSSSDVVLDTHFDSASDQICVGPKVRVPA